MTELYINNKLVDLPTDFKITLVTENVYFSKASTYTYDIELPMAPLTNNARIFGSLNRLDKTASTAAMPARLIVDNKLILDGTAIIVGVKENSVSVQLLQGNSELNWKSKYENTYIDELDLGHIHQWHFNVQQRDGATRIQPDDDIGSTERYENYRVWEQRDISEANNGDVVCTPIYNSETGELMNNLKTYSPSGSYAQYWRTFFRIGMEGASSHDFPYYAPQPKLKLMVEMVFAKLGLDIVYNELDSYEWYTKAFIANSTEIVAPQNVLPHWTFVEFVEQLQLLFNCIVIPGKHSTRIVLKKKHYHQTNGAPIEEVESVLDSFETDVEAETEIADTDQPKQYDINYPDYGVDFLGDDFDSVPIYDIDQLNGTANPFVFSRNVKGIKVSSPYKENGKVKGNEIDIYEKSPGAGNDKKTIKLVPLMPDQDTDDIRFHYYLVNGSTVDDGHWGYYHFTLPSSYGIEADYDAANIQDLLDSGETPPSRPTIEKLTLGFLTKRWLQVPKGSGTFVLTHYDVLTCFNVYSAVADYAVDNISRQPYVMSMQPFTYDGNEPLKNLHYYFYRNIPAILTSNTTVVNFIPRRVFDPLNRFLIKNQLYACKQIKYTITARGFDRIAEGEFYKL